MADETPVFQIQRMYLKDLSLEQPNSPQILLEQTQPQVDINLAMGTEQRDRMIQLTGRRTVPQIFIGETHVGGCDDLIALDLRGGLMPLLQGV